MFSNEIQHSILTCLDGTIFFYLHERILFMSQICKLDDAPLGLFAGWICLVDECANGLKDRGLKENFIVPKVDLRCSNAYIKSRASKGPNIRNGEGTGLMYGCVSCLVALHVSPVADYFTDLLKNGPEVK